MKRPTLIDQESGPRPPKSPPAPQRRKPKAREAEREPATVAEAAIHNAEAMDYFLKRQHLFRRGARRLPQEPWSDYNGAHGDPCDEEIVEQHGEIFVTRTSQGTRCLNAPRVLFADIDFPVTISALASLELSRSRMGAFVTRRPEWSFRLYRTPAGLRAIATHDLFTPAAAVVVECFEALAVDTTYAQMCWSQDSFRARLSAKTARIGAGVTVPPSVPPSPAWVEGYEQAAAGFAACRYYETIGSGVTHPQVAPVVALHDDRAKAHTALPIA